MQPDEPNDEERQEELPQDNGQTPFQPAAPAPDDATADPQATAAPPVDDTHPATDTDVDKQELYDAGTGAATNAEEPERQSDVTAFDPPEHPESPS